MNVEEQAVPMVVSAKHWYGLPSFFR